MWMVREGRSVYRPALLVKLEMFVLELVKLGTWSPKEFELIPSIGSVTMFGLKDR